MTSQTGVSLILLTYKGKVLIKLHESNPRILDKPTNLNPNTWSFFTAVKDKNKSFEESIVKKVENETSIKLSNATFLLELPLNDTINQFFSARLTDDNVNNMKRPEGQTLQFFTFKEVVKLQLTKLTDAFVREHSELFLQLG